MAHDLLRRPQNWVLRRQLPSSDLVVIDLTTDAGKMISAAKERNSLAMANLTMEFETENLFGLIYKTMSTDWPAGLAHEVFVQLFNNYSAEIEFQELN